MKRKAGLHILESSLSLALFVVRVNRLNGAVLIVGQLGKLDVAFIVRSAGKGAVMVEEVPFILELNDGVMGRPADYGS